MPEGESVSMTAVPEARTLKLVFATLPCASLPSQSSASNCSFLKAVAERVPAQTGRAINDTSSRRSESSRRNTSTSWKRTAQDVATLRIVMRRDMSGLTPEAAKWKHPRKEIGRASCRERVEVWEGGAALKQKKEEMERGRTSGTLQE